MSANTYVTAVCFFCLMIFSQITVADGGDCGLANIFPESPQLVAYTTDLSKLRAESKETKLVINKSSSGYSLQAVSLAESNALHVFSKSLDYEQYPGLKIPGVLETKILSEGDQTKVVWFHTNLLGQDARYSVNVQFKQTQEGASPQYLISWDLAQSDDGRLGKMSGQWCVSQVSETEVLIRYDVGLEFHTSIPSFFYSQGLESQMKSDYQKMFSAFIQ